MNVGPFCTRAILPLYSCPIEYSQLTHFACNITLSTQWYSKPIGASVDSGIRGSQVSWCLFLKLLSCSFALFSSVYGGQFRSVKGESDELVHISKRTFYFPFSHPFFLTCPVRRNFIPHISTIVPSQFKFPSCMIFWIPFHHFCLW